MWNSHWLISTTLPADQSKHGERERGFKLDKYCPPYLTDKVAICFLNAVQGNPPLAPFNDEPNIVRVRR